ncbi:CCHC-type domain-containing protein [Trichonephila clavipes]|nr:CCHC-type domain-containing protein [Trichonephila clavipes]
MYKNALKEDLIRVVEDLDGTVESTDTIAKLKTKIENSSTFESDPDFVKTLIQNCIDERVSRNEREVTLEKQKIELAKLQLAKLEKEIELQRAKNKALSLNPAAKVEDKQFETNIENMINSIRTLSLPVSTRSENFNLFFQSLERAFLTKKINDEYKSEILINLLGERAHNVLLYIKEEELNDYEKLKSIETTTHIGIREAEDWFRPIDLAKECDIYISSRSGSHKEIPITYGCTQDPFKNRSQNFKPKIKENYPQYLERENKNCFICGDSSHCARDCEKRFKPKESNDHIHNRINVNTLKVESEKQNSDEFANLQYVNIFVENQPVTALIDSGCQIPVLNSSLIRVQTPSEEIITLSSCFGEQRMVEVKPINISLNQHSPGLSVRTAISPTLTEEIIIHPSVYSEIKKLGHAKSDVLLNESESSLSADLGAYAYPSAVSFSNVSFSNVIENSSCDLPYVKNFNTRNDLSSLIKDYKCNKIKSTKLKLSIIREKCSDIVLCKKVNGAMKTSSVEFISRSPTPSPMNSKYRRTLERKISMRSTKVQLVKKDVLMPVKHNVFLWNLPDVEESLSVPSFLYVSDSPLVSMEKEKREVPLRTAYSQAGRCGMQPKPSSLRAQAQLNETKTETMRTETVETFELVKVEQKLLREKQKRERERGARVEAALATAMAENHYSTDSSNKKGLYKYRDSNPLLERNCWSRGLNHSAPATAP